MTEAAAHPNLDVVNKVYKAMMAGDRATLEALHKPDVVLHVSGSGASSGDYVGREAVLGVANESGDLGETRTEVHDLLWSPEHVVALVKVTSIREGETLEQRIVQVVHVEEGQIAEIWEYLWDQDADARFWARHWG